MQSEFTRPSFHRYHIFWLIFDKLLIQSLPVHHYLSLTLNYWPGVKHQEWWNIKQKLKIPHAGNTRPSHTCVIQEYRYYTMSLSQYHGCCQYNESISIPWVLVNTINPCLYHESMCIPRVYINTFSPCQFHSCMSIPWVISNNISQYLYHESRNNTNTSFRNTETEITGLQK